MLNPKEYTLRGICLVRANPTLKYHGSGPSNTGRLCKSLDCRVTVARQSTATAEQARACFSISSEIADSSALVHFGTLGGVAKNMRVAQMLIEREPHLDPQMLSSADVRLKSLLGVSK